MHSPFASRLRHQRALVLDGGLATTLEERGLTLADELWSAKVLVETPQEIWEVHREFLMAGADCITSSSYQASVEGFRRRGISRTRALELLQESVRLALDARDVFWSDPDNRDGREQPMVAASVGPYGAFLADGSEYTGSYQTGDAELFDFHRQRWQVLASSAADVLACETIPSGREVDVLLRLARGTPDRPTWVSLSCRDEMHLSDGTPVVDVARSCDAVPNVVAVGINCTMPEYVTPLLIELRRGTQKPLIAYPNSGERYDAGAKTWTARPSPVRWQARAVEWIGHGAVAVGGCCRVGPKQIASLREALVVG